VSAEPAAGRGEGRGGDIPDDVLDFAHRIFDLARDGAADELTAHLDAGLPVNLTNGQGDTLLILAAYHRHAPTVRVLLAHGADPNRVNDRGQPALGAAVFRQDTDAVRALLEAGADPHVGRQSGVVTAQVFDLPKMLALLSAVNGPTSPGVPSPG